MSQLAMESCQFVGHGNNGKEVPVEWGTVKKYVEERRRYKGHPWGKKPVTMLNVTLLPTGTIYRCVGEREHDDGAGHTYVSVHDGLVGTGADSVAVGASRCFKIEFTDQDEKERTKWIFASTDHHLNEVFNQARELQALKHLSLLLDFDWGPRSAACKTVARLAIGKGEGRGKGGL